MKKLYGVILSLVAVVTALYAIAGAGFGIFGVVVALSVRNGGFVGEEFFYASALLLISLAVIATGLVSGVISYVCWKLLCWYAARDTSSEAFITATPEGPGTGR